MSKKMRNATLAVLALVTLAGIVFNLKIEPAGPKAGDNTGELSCRIEIRCDVLLDSSVVTNEAILPYIPEDGTVLAATEVKFSEGESAFAVLQRTCGERQIAMDFANDSVVSGEYIKGLGHIYYGDAGETSGWLYLVNGESIDVGCGKYAVQDGDVITWAFSRDMGADLTVDTPGAGEQGDGDSEQGETDKQGNNENENSEKENENDTSDTPDKIDGEQTAGNGDQQGDRAESAAPAKPSCTLEIRCDTIVDTSKVKNQAIVPYIPGDGVILARTEVEFEDGESVFDVLQRVCRAKNIHMEFESGSSYNSTYIQGINYIYEFDAGDLSGWKYKVNGGFPNYGCSSYTLKDGDAVVWCYTCDLGADIGDAYQGDNNG